MSSSDSISISSSSSSSPSNHAFTAVSPPETLGRTKTEIVFQVELGKMKGAFDLMRLIGMCFASHKDIGGGGVSQSQHRSRIRRIIFNLLLSSFPGITSIAVDRGDKTKTKLLTVVIGDSVDAVAMAVKLRKFGHTQIVSVKEASN